MCLMLSRQKFAAKLGVGRGEYYRWSYGLHRPGQRYMTRVAHLSRLQLQGRFDPSAPYGREYWQRIGM